MVIPMMCCKVRHNCDVVFIRIYSSHSFQYGLPMLLRKSVPVVVYPSLMSKLFLLLRKRIEDTVIVEQEYLGIGVLLYIGILPLLCWVRIPHRTPSRLGTDLQSPSPYMRFKGDERQPQSACIESSAPMTPLSLLGMNRHTCRHASIASGPKDSSPFRMFPHSLKPR